MSVEHALKMISVLVVILRHYYIAIHQRVLGHVLIFFNHFKCISPNATIVFGVVADAIVVKLAAAALSLKSWWVETPATTPAMGTHTITLHVHENTIQS
jgi:hypothetical protein